MAHAANASGSPGHLTVLAPRAWASALDRSLHEIAHEEPALRERLGRLGAELVCAGAYHPLGFARLGDYCRERLGISARELESIIQVVARSDRLPALRAAFRSGELSWTQVRLLSAVAEPDSDTSWVAAARGRTVRQLEALIQSNPAARNTVTAAALNECAEKGALIENEPATVFRLACPAAVRIRWRHALELARRMAGESLAVWQAAEAIVAEASTNPRVHSAFAAQPATHAARAGTAAARQADLGVDRTVMPASLATDAAVLTRQGSAAVVANGFAASADSEALAAASVAVPSTLSTSPAPPEREAIDPFLLDAELRSAVEALLGHDARLGEALRPILDQRLYQLLGFSSAAQYVRERVGISRGKASALLVLERTCTRSGDFATAYRRGELSWARALAIVPVLRETNAPEWIARANAVTVRQLNDQVDWALNMEDAFEAEAIAPPAGVLLSADDILRLRGATAAGPTPITASNGVTSAAVIGGTSSEASAVQMRARQQQLASARNDAEIRFLGPASIVVLVRSTLQGYAQPGFPLWTAFDRLLRHVIAEWERQPRHRDPIFARDGWRCTVPAVRGSRSKTTTSYFGHAGAGTSRPIERRCARRTTSTAFISTTSRPAAPRRRRSYGSSVSGGMDHHCSPCSEIGTWSRRAAGSGLIMPAPHSRPRHHGYTDILLEPLGSRSSSTHLNRQGRQQSTLQRVASSQKELRAWTIKDSIELYNVNGWGRDFFTINEAGHVEVTPAGPGSASIDLKELVDDLRSRGLNLPVLIRFSDILRTRIQQLCGSFQQAITENDYRGQYRGVYPIKVNQQRHVVEELVEYGRPFNLGIEAGSKPELLVALALQDNPDALILCNGYKDRAYIETALLAHKLGRQVIIVIDQIGELETILQASRDLDIRPIIGVRARLTTKGAGKWVESTGDRSKFGLTTAEMVSCVDRLRAENMLDCLQLLHFHIGSQITNIRAVKDALRESSRIFVELYLLGAPMHFLDCGGGLGVDYDGSQSNFHSSMNYTLQEYASDIVSQIAEVCNEKGVPHPDIVTESGRALVAHHSVLVFNVLGTNEILDGHIPDSLGDTEHTVIKQLYETYAGVSRKNFQEAYHDALQIKEEAITAFNLGLLDLKQRARAEQLFWATCEKILKIIRDLPYVPDDLEGLERQLSDTYYCNFSIFQSIPDHWAVRQLFPTMPIDRLNRVPTRQGILADLTCDSDGKMDQFIDLRDVKHSLELHPLNGEPYYIATFLVGAYQEILGDLHNLFGDTDAVHVRLDGDDYRVEHVVEGDSVSEVLSYVQYSKADLVSRVRRAVEAALRDKRLTMAESGRLLRRYEEALEGYTYLTSNE